VFGFFFGGLRPSFLKGVPTFFSLSPRALDPSCVRDVCRLSFFLVVPFLWKVPARTTPPGSPDLVRDFGARRSRKTWPSHSYWLPSLVVRLVPPLQLWLPLSLYSRYSRLFFGRHVFFSPFCGCFLRSPLRTPHSSFARMSIVFPPFDRAVLSRPIS